MAQLSQPFLRPLLERDLGEPRIEPVAPGLVGLDGMNEAGRIGPPGEVPGVLPPIGVRYRTCQVDESVFLIDAMTG